MGPIICLLVVSMLMIMPSDLGALTISADSLVHLTREGKYELLGNVFIKHDDVIIKADKALVYDASLDVIAEGNVYYEDLQTLINAERAELNLHTKTGEIHRAVILFKEGNYWTISENLKKIADDRYLASSARFTTCNPSSPDLKGYTYERAKEERFDWCFYGKDVDIELGKDIRAKGVSYKVKDIPVGYSPKIWAPISGQRTSGLLMPLVGNSSQNGLRFAPAFFWVIDEDKDMTIGLDYYSKRGLGMLVQFRYIEPKGKGEFNVYHLYDRAMDDTQLQILVKQDHRNGPISEFIDINYAKSIDMFKEYTYGGLDRAQRFLQSSGEIAMDLNHGRLYLLGQYWIDMKHVNTQIPQRLPEVGYVLYPKRLGPFMIEMGSSVSSFYSENGLKAQRLDLMPTISHAFGDALQVYQSLSLRETAYNLQNNPEGRSTEHRETLRYNVQAKGRLVKRYDSLEHIIEPSVEYDFIPARFEIPIFDSAETFNDRSEARASLLNLFRLKGSIIAARITQPYSLKGPNDRLAPTVFNGAFIGRPFTLRLETSYDFNLGQIQTLYTNLSLPLSNRVNLSIGERYSRQYDIHQYRTSIDTKLSDRWAASTNLWYDAKGGGLRDSMVSLRYTDQCWGTVFTLTRRPRYNDQSADYSLMFLVELKGLGSIGKK